LAQKAISKLQSQSKRMKMVGPKLKTTVTMRIHKRRRIKRKEMKITGLMKPLRKLRKPLRNLRTVMMTMTKVVI